MIIPIAKITNNLFHTFTCVDVGVCDDGGNYLQVKIHKVDTNNISVIPCSKDKDLHDE